MKIDIRDNVNIESFYQNFRESEGHGAFDKYQCDEDAIVRCEYCDRDFDNCNCYSPCCGAYLGDTNGDGSFKDFDICPECGEHI